MVFGKKKPDLEALLTAAINRAIDQIGRVQDQHIEEQRGFARVITAKVEDHLGQVAVLRDEVAALRTEATVLQVEISMLKARLSNLEQK